MSRPVSEEYGIGFVKELRKVNFDPCCISDRRASLADDYQNTSCAFGRRVSFPNVSDAGYGFIWDW